MAGGEELRELEEEISEPGEVDLLVESMPDSN